MSNRKFKIKTLGCRTNQYESQAYHDQLTSMGYSNVVDDQAAEICIVNTCTVTESADSHSRQAIRQLARENPNAKIVVTGCFAERQPEFIKSIPGVTHVISNKEKENLVASLFPEEDVPEFSIKNFDAHTRAFVKVQDGCNSFCTYCIIPYVRGRSRSRDVQEIVDEIKNLIANGYKEVVLTGINVGDFDASFSNSQYARPLANLVSVVDQIPGLERLRISSIDPDEVDEELIDIVLNGRTTCKSMHLVLQSGSNHILKRMNRKYTRQIFLDSVDQLKSRSSDFTITTDIIVGFPGETEEDFEDTLTVMREVKFAKVHMFPYSDRPRTKAATYQNKVPIETIKERKQRLLRLAEETSFSLRNEFVGKKMRVLTETSDATHQGYVNGHTDNFLQVRIKGEIDSNQLVDVILEKNESDCLIGKVKGEG